MVTAVANRSLTLHVVMLKEKTSRCLCMQCKDKQKNQTASTVEIIQSASLSSKSLSAKSLPSPIKNVDYMEKLSISKKCKQSTLRQCFISDYFYCVRTFSYYWSSSKHKLTVTRTISFKLKHVSEDIINSSCKSKHTETDLSRKV